MPSLAGADRPRGLLPDAPRGHFDLDHTLHDTSVLLGARDRRAWAEVYGGLHLATTFEVPDQEVAVSSLPD